MAHPLASLSRRPIEAPVAALAPEPAPEPEPPIDPPAPPTVTDNAINNVETYLEYTQPALDQIAAGNHTLSFNTVNDQIEFWQNLNLEDGSDPNQVGTVSYFAVSIRDFFSQMGDLYDAGAPPSVMVDQWNLWSEYAVDQSGKSFGDMQPFDVWFHAR